jgi:hypothetical protein
LTKAVAALTVAAAALRILGIDAKGFWHDEAYTIARIELDFGSMLDAVVEHEATPPLYFAVAWLWTQAFGLGEVGVRSLSVLIGAATVPIAYLAAKELVSRRAGLVVALLVTVNPLLVWYGQEARAYALLLFFFTLSLLFLARSLHASDERLGREVTWWALASAAALATHHFAVFVIAVEALWLLWARRDARPPRVAAGALAVAGAAVAALAAAQRDEGGGDWISGLDLIPRVVEIPGVFMTGFEAPAPILLAALGCACAAIGLWLAATATTRAERDGAALAATLAAAPVAVAIVLSLAGLDYLLYRNVLPALVAVLVVLGAGFGARRAGWAGAAALAVLCVLSLGVVLATSDQPKYRKEVWREVGIALGPAPNGRAIVVTPGVPAAAGLTVYIPGSRLMGPEETAVSHMSLGAERADVGEVVLAAAARRDAGSTEEPTTPRFDAPPPPPPGFRYAGREDGEGYVLFRYRAPHARPVSAATLEPRRLDDTLMAVLLQPR